MSERPVFVVSDLQMSLLLETARRRFGFGYARWFTERWVRHVTKGEGPPGNVEDWIEDTKEE